MSSTPKRWQHLEPYVFEVYLPIIKRYDQIMNSTNDVIAIAKVYGYLKLEVQRAKNYAFGDGVSHHEFYPDEDMAEAWERLAKGQGNEIDLIFLNHEIYESHLVESHNIEQSLAHDITQIKYPWKNRLRGINL